MDILLTLAIVILAAAIVVFFSQEFTAVFKKIFAIKGATLVLPLVFASYLVYQFEDWVIWGLLYFHEVLENMIKAVSWILPASPLFTSIATIIVLLLFSIGLKLGLDLIARKRTYKPYRYTNITVFIIWLVSVFTWILL